MGLYVPTGFQGDWEGWWFVEMTLPVWGIFLERFECEKMG